MCSPEGSPPSTPLTRCTMMAHSRIVILAILSLGSCAECQRPVQQADTRLVPSGTRAELTLLASTDVHANVLSYDYFKLVEDPSLGFERLATLIRQVRQEFPESLLFDIGDTIQGTALADYQARVNPVACNEELAVYKAMDAVGYDGGTLGNHDFNFGLPFLGRVTGTAFDSRGGSKVRCAGPRFPLVVSNVFSLRDHRPLFPPSLVLLHPIHATAPDGSLLVVPLRVGILGLVPPEVAIWERDKLQGQASVELPLPAAQEQISKLRDQGVDVIVVLAHGGGDSSPAAASTEDFSWHLSKVPGIDAMLLGHGHEFFPAPKEPAERFVAMPGVDNARGTINGVPAVMGGFWGKALGLIRLALRYQSQRWQVDLEHTRSEVRLTQTADGQYVAPDPAIRKLVAAEHAATIRYIRTPIGVSDFRITSYFAELGDVSSLQLVNMAQREYVRRYLKARLPKYAKLPVVSVAAPFRTGFGGASDYTDIPAGRLEVHNAAELYLYDNTLVAVKVSGAELAAWLETAAMHFNQIDVRRVAPQPLVNPDVPAYDFDVLQGEVSYVIDVTQPVGRRIQALRYRGQPVHAAQEFVVVTNNYRANGGGRFPGLDGSKTILAPNKLIRGILIDSIRRARYLLRSRVGSERSWQFAKVRTAGPVIFISASNKLAVARDAGLRGITQLKDSDHGMGTYAVDLSR